MTDEQFDKIIRNAADAYNVPPVNPPLDPMWAAIETESFGHRIGQAKPRFSLMHSPWLRMAAVLVLGVAIGRFTTRGPKVPDTAVVSELAVSAQADPAAYDLTTERFLGQTVTLLVGLPGQLQSGRVDSTFVSKAGESLSELRLLMDSPAASNPRLRALFEDLELVLVQVVQMPKDGSRTDAKMIRQAMQERDVMPRLRDAVADNPN